ncbi:PREDICTED: G2/mitotic-specific cyclin S13-7-like [Fragaria vesca subsp. vesca]|uniref:G2/mitotic-specific cyclin S13-7-like n=1 Tax=Fragaria vesca subsp. vesca TaxID=101020 RepID=UPI0002C34830|nr:PREDICTED: G2/mitotic-specific cyclin S13-7-like [Fragaria vesca subsp. vesca]
MDTRAVVPPHPRGNGKVHGEAPRRNQRVALEDRTNLGAGQVEIEGKPAVQITRRITRSFHAQLLANAQKNNGNPVLVPGVVDKEAKNRNGSAGKKVTKKAADEDVVVISSDEENEKPVNRGKPVQGPRKEVKTLTSILTARSKAMACGDANKPKEQIVDFDKADVNDELAGVEYVDELYKFYKLEEDECRVGDYMDKQPDINSKMRAILVDWLIDVHRKFELMPETFYLTVNITDRFLSRRMVTRRELQLVGISSMVIASKYEEVWAPQVNDFVCLSDYAYSDNQIRAMEKAILQKLEWYLTVPTPYVFLARYIKASISPDDEMKNMVFFLAELGVLDYQTTIRHSPSMIAAAAVYAARCTLNKMPFWTETLKHHTGYCEEDLRECAKVLVGFHSKAGESDVIKAVYKKYTKPEYGAVARRTPAKIC